MTLTTRLLLTKFLLIVCVFVLAACVSKVEPASPPSSDDSDSGASTPMTNLLVDGDFTTPAQSAQPGETWFNPGSTLGAWLVDGTSTQIAAGLFVPEHTTLPSGVSGQTCWLSEGPSGGSISQVVPTILGHQYKITFYVGNDPYWTSAATTVTVVWNGTNMGNSTSPAGGATATSVDPISPAWAIASLTVTATSTSSTLQFVAPITSFTDSVALSDVQMVDLGQ